jgi:hypothetical protein
MPPVRGNRFNRNESKQSASSSASNASSSSRSNAPSNPAPRVSTKTEDFLKNDANIPGQNYVCMSFISPEEVIMNKHAFFVHTYMKNLLSRFNFSEEPSMEELKYFKDEMSKFLSPESAEDKFKDFVAVHQDEIEKQYYEQNNFQTTIRGVKVRGVYDTYREAQVRAEELRVNDRNFNVYIGQVGYWLPWDPNPLSIKDQEFQETELNTLVKKYNENLKMKDQHFQENIDYVREQAAKAAEKKKAEQAQSAIEVLTGDTESTPAPVDGNDDNQSSQSLSDELSEQDPWLARKAEQAEEKKVDDSADHQDN